MRNGILKTTALALGLGMATGLAYAQTDATQKLENEAGAATKSTQKMQGQKMQGQAGAEMKSSGGTSAQGQADAKTDATAQSGSGAAATEGGATAQGGADVKKDRAASGQAGSETNTTAQGGSGEQQDPAASGQSNTTAEGTMKKDGSDSSASGTGGAKTDSTAQGQSGSDATQDNAAGDPGVSSETTASVNVTAEQQTELKTVFTETKVDPVTDIDVNVSIGTAVPQTIELHPLPPRVVTIVPAYEGYEYFVLSDGRIVIVEPATFEIVYILSA